jgi:hypothetical protein
MKTEEPLQDPTATLTADIQRMLAEAHDAVKAFRDVQAQATRAQTAEAKATLAVLKSNELVRIKTRVPQLATRLPAVTAGLRDRTERAKIADKALDAAIDALGKHLKQLRG